MDFLSCLVIAQSFKRRLANIAAFCPPRKIDFAD